MKKIRSDSKYSDLPVVAISANATEHDIEEGLEAGFDEYITKPINIDNFMRQLSRYLN